MQVAVASSSPSNPMMLCVMPTWPFWPECSRICRARECERCRPSTGIGPYGSSAIWTTSKRETPFGRSIALWTGSARPSSWTTRSLGRSQMEPVPALSGWPRDVAKGAMRYSHCTDGCRSPSRTWKHRAFCLEQIRVLPLAHSDHISRSHACDHRSTCEHACTRGSQTLRYPMRGSESWCSSGATSAIAPRATKRSPRGHCAARMTRIEQAVRIRHSVATRTRSDGDYRKLGDAFEGPTAREDSVQWVY